MYLVRRHTMKRQDSTKIIILTIFTTFILKNNSHVILPLLEKLNHSGLVSSINLITETTYEHSRYILTLGISINENSIVKHFI